MTKDQNKLIAEKVMGWKKVDLELGGYYWTESGISLIADEQFNPIINANDDQIVLNHIRETWTDKQWFEFSLTYYNTLVERDKETGGVSLILKHHKPGDYSRAALKVLEEE